VVLKSLYDANSILAATADNTPAALTVAASTVVGRASSGDIVALTAAQQAHHRWCVAGEQGRHCGPFGR
jgi:hypothetical protein